MDKNNGSSRENVNNSNRMNPIQTHPENAAQAKTFIAPGSLSFPTGAQDLTPPPSEADKNYQQKPNGQAPANGNVTPATPAATPGAIATQGVSGIVPTLQ